MVARTRSQSGAASQSKTTTTPPRGGRIEKPMRNRWLDDEVGAATRIQRQEHPVGWTEHGHYLTLTYGREVSPTARCGDQSCPCCRARVFRSGLDAGAIYGACPICLRA